jgi:hypothetical protein
MGGHNELSTDLNTRQAFCRDRFIVKEGEKHVEVLP